MTETPTFSRFRRRLILIGYLLSGGLISTAAVGWYLYAARLGEASFTEYLSAAISGLALVWLLVGIYLQGYEISLQTQEMAESKAELARQAEALLDQARIASSQAEAVKVSTSTALYQNLMVDMAREIRLGLELFGAYDSERHIENLEVHRVAGNLSEYVDSFYVDLLGVHGSYDLIHYLGSIASERSVLDIDEWRRSDLERLSFALCLSITRNLSHLSSFHEQVAVLQLATFQRYDFLSHVLASLVALIDVSRIWKKLGLDHSQMTRRLVPLAASVDRMLVSYTSRVDEYPDFDKWEVLKLLRDERSIVRLWEKPNEVAEC